MDSNSWINCPSVFSSSSSSRRCQSRSDLYIGGGYEDLEGEDDLKSEFICPFCAEVFDIVGLCCHIDEEHPVEVKNGVCPVCTKRVGLDIVGHITTQHANFFKVQRRRRLRKGGYSSAYLALKKELREANLQSLLGGSSSSFTSSTNIDSDPLLSSFMFSSPPSKSVVEGTSATKVSHKASLKRDIQEAPLSGEDQEGLRLQKAQNFSEITNSTMEPEKVRIRLVFEDQRVLSNSQKKQGLKRSWVVLNPKSHRTVSEFSDHLLHTFCLFEACPHGISLYMDGFVLPPFESSCVLKDKDIVCVKRKKEPLLEIVEEDSEENVCAEIEEAEERAPGAVLFANEEFQKGTGGYESESEEDELEEIVVEKKTSKKRKASSKSTSSSKRKKCKLATTEESPVEKENESVVRKGNAVKKSKTSDAQRTENDQQNEVKAKSMTKSKKSSQQDKSKEPNEQCNLSGETKKTPSRSARRKKAKRQWLREKTKQEKEEYLQLKQKQMVVAPTQKPAFTINHQVTKENRSEALETQQPDENGDGVGDEVVPVEVRPDHIRFEPLDETDQASAEEIAPPAEKFVWNGNMTKKKGQKWGTEKAGLSKRYAQDMDEDTYQTEPAEAETVAKGQIDFEQLLAYSGSLKKGDVIAYRLIELTSSWTPEVSSFRVGKISNYDPESKKVTLMPVEEYPIEKKTEEDTDDSSMQPDTSLYKEDGSLEIEFSSLLDVRCIKTSSSSDTAEAAKSAPSKPDQTATSLKLSTDNGLQTPVKENGKVDPWEELSDALSAKKAQLAQANNGGWNKKGSSSGGSAWSYKALRGSGMGPVMKYLRSQKEI